MAAAAPSIQSNNSTLSTLASKIGRLVSPERSEQRGRDETPYISSGRGGAGNIRQSSLSRDARPYEESPPRGREGYQHPTTATHSGRGGAGNVRSPSRDPAQLAREAKDIEREREIIAARSASQERAISSGRGGAGNISTSRSRSRSRGPALSPSARVNIDPSELAALEEEEKAFETRARQRAHPHPETEVYATGRGGAGNLRVGAEPGPRRGDFS